jgi:hypothetical protein
MTVKGSAARGVGLARHFAGWQPAALAVFLAGVTTLLVVPRPVDPVDLPEPRIDLRAIAQVARQDDALAEGADRERLDVDVLALGTAIFAYGEADAAGDDLALARERQRVLDEAERAQKVGAPSILALRAHHLRSFLQEIRRWEATGEESPKLRQLSGGFVRMVRRNGWSGGKGADAPSARPRILMDRTVLAAFFKKHWNEVTGLAGPPFDLILDESRAFYRFLLQHPIPPPVGPRTEPGAAPRGIGGLDVKRAFEAQYRLKKLDELTAVDPSFPIHLARGIVLYELRRYPLAVEAFRLHLERSPDGPFTLRAQNYLRAALGRAREE